MNHGGQPQAPNDEAGAARQGPIARLLGRLGCLLLVALGLALILFGLVIHVNVLAARELVGGDRSVEGVVTATQKSSRGGRHFSYTYSVRADGFRKERVSIRSDDHARLQAGSVVRVWYHPAHPGKSMTREELAEIEFLPNRLVFPIIGSLCVIWGLRALLRRRSRPA